MESVLRGNVSNVPAEKESKLSQLVMVWVTGLHLCTYDPRLALGVLLRRIPTVLTQTGTLDASNYSNHEICTPCNWIIIKNLLREGKFKSSVSEREFKVTSQAATGNSAVRIRHFALLTACRCVRSSSSRLCSVMARDFSICPARAEKQTVWALLQKQQQELKDLTLRKEKQCYTCLHAAWAEDRSTSVFQRRV